MSDRLDLTIGEVARYLRISDACARKKVTAGVIAGYRVPGSRHQRVPPAELIRVMTSCGYEIPRELRRRDESVKTSVAEALREC